MIRKTMAIAVMAIMVSGIVGVSMYNDASADSVGNKIGQSTTYAQGISSNDFHGYSTKIPANTTNFAAALIINNGEEKDAFTLYVISPESPVTECDIAEKVFFELLVSECKIDNPVAGSWTIAVQTGNYSNSLTEHVGYAIVTDMASIQLLIVFIV